jgi:hypothetical protein
MLCPASPSFPRITGAHNAVFRCSMCCLSQPVTKLQLTGVLAVPYVDLASQIAACQALAGLNRSISDRCHLAVFRKGLQGNNISAVECTQSLNSLPVCCRTAQMPQSLAQLHPQHNHSSRPHSLSSCPTALPRPSSCLLPACQLSLQIFKAESAQVLQGDKMHRAIHIANTAKVPQALTA